MVYTIRVWSYHNAYTRMVHPYAHVWYIPYAYGTYYTRMIHTICVWYIPYAYGMYHTHIRIWYDHTRMVHTIYGTKYAYGTEHLYIKRQKILMNQRKNFLGLRGRFTPNAEPYLTTEALLQQQKKELNREQMPTSITWALS